MPKSDSVDSAKRCSCTKCEKPFQSRNFYKSNSSFYINGYLPICKDCLDETFEMYVKEYHSAKRAVQRICMAYDIYYSDAIYNKCLDGDGSISIATYIQKSSMPQHKNKTFDTSLGEGFYFTGESNGINMGVADCGEEPEADPKLVEKWGAGFLPDDYEVLESHYITLKKNNPNANNNQEIFITSLCHLNMMMVKALKNADLDGYAKANDQYSKTFTKAGLKTVQEVDMSSDDCWGEWVRRIEEYTPAEYYKNKSLFKDFDGIGDYFKRFVLRPLKNLMHGTTDRDYEYCVKDGDENEDSEPN